MVLLPNGTGSRHEVRVQQHLTSFLSLEDVVIDYEPCPRGTFNNASERKCEVCEPGSVASSEGSPSCSECVAGTYSNAARTDCDPCKPVSWEGVMSRTGRMVTAVPTDCFCAALL